MLHENNRQKIGDMQHKRSLGRRRGGAFSLHELRRSLGFCTAEFGTRVGLVD